MIGCKDWDNWNPLSHFSVTLQNKVKKKVRARKSTQKQLQRLDILSAEQAFHGQHVLRSDQHPYCPKHYSRSGVYIVSTTRMLAYC